MAGWRRSELKAGVYDEIVSARLGPPTGGTWGSVRSASLRADRERSDRRSARIAARGWVRPGTSRAEGRLRKGLALAEALLAVLRSHAPRVFERDDELRLIAERLTAIVARPATSARAAARIAPCLEPDCQC